MRTVLSVLLVLAVAPAIGHAQASPAEAATRERLARQIEAELMAPCCWSQQVSLHESPAATEIRADIRRRLTAGQTHDLVLDAYVAEYGQRILAVPPAKGFNYLLFILPALLFLASGLVVVQFVRKASRQGQADLANARATPPPGTDSERLQQRLDDELRDLD